MATLTINPIVRPADYFTGIAPAIRCTCPNCGQVIEDDDDTSEVVTGHDLTETWHDSCSGDASVCDACERYTESTEEVDTNNGPQFWCPDCASMANECENCNSLTTEELTTVNTTYGHEEWCNDCVNTETHYCPRCDENHNMDTTRVCVRDDWFPSNREYEEWCEDCASEDTVRCERCDEVFAEGAIEEYHMWDDSYRYLCRDCRDSYSWCYECEQLVADDDAEWIDDEPYCPNCARRYHEEHRGGLQSYGHTSGSVFWLDDGTNISAYNLYPDHYKKMYLGVELETDYNDDARRLARDITDAYDGTMIECKRDGSLNQEGVEIVSQPMTPIYHLTSGIWQNIIRIVKQHGGSSHDAGTCGLHIHINRESLYDDDAVYRLDRLFHRFAKQMIRFSRRKAGGMWYCKLDSYDDLANIKTVEERKAKWKHGKEYEDRYHAVNDKNSKTVEIRLWRGTLNEETLFATIQFTAGLALIVRSMSNEFADQLTWSMLKVCVQFALEENGIPHAELDTYLERRGL